MSIYSDVDTKDPTVKKILKDEVAVFRALDNLFGIDKNERLFNPDFGGKWKNLLFELFDDTAELQLYRLVDQEVNRWEPRVILDSSKTEITRDRNEHKFNISLFFTIQGLEGKNFEFFGSLKK